MRALGQISSLALSVTVSVFITTSFLSTLDGSVSVASASALPGRYFHQQEARRCRNYLANKAEAERRKAAGLSGADGSANVIDDETVVIAATPDAGAAGSSDGADAEVSASDDFDPASCYKDLEASQTWENLKEALSNVF